MYEIFANNTVPKGSYVCLECGCITEIENKTVLLPCRDCGGEKFRASVYVTLTREQLFEKYDEAMKLLAKAVYMYDVLRMPEFLNVISINLRMLLCDGENSLLPKMVDNPKFNRSADGFEDNVLMPSKLLENPIMPMSLEDFLNQVVIKRPGSRPITIKKMIRASANKCGGAHIDSEMEEDFFISSGVSKYYFVRIAKYIIKLAGYDYEKIVAEFKDRCKLFE